MPYPHKEFREWVAEEEKIGNVVRIKQPIKCGDYNNIVDLGNDVPGKCPETEVRALVRYLHSLPGKPIGIIEKPVCNRPDIPVVVNPWATQATTLRGLGCKDKDELCEKVKQWPTKKIKANVVSKKNAVCKDVVITEDKVDLRKDIPRIWVEFCQVLWSPCNGTVVVYDPETGTHDLTKQRGANFEWVNADPKKPESEERQKRYMAGTMALGGTRQTDIGKFYAKHLKAGKPMPAAYILDVPTDMNIVATSKGTLFWPQTGDEYEVLGGMRGEPVDIVESETIPGLMVPAQAEWVIEGEFLPELIDEPMYAADIASGHMVTIGKIPLFKVKCITHRKNPIWGATTFSGNGMNGHEGPHSGLFIVVFDCEATNHLRNLGFEIKAVTSLRDASVAVVQSALDGKDAPPYYGKRIGMALYGNPAKYLGTNSKYTIIVGPDIDPNNWTDVMWALGNRSMPVSDMITIEKGLCGWGDPGGFKEASTGRRYYGEQVIIDALIKVPERYDSWPPRSEPAEWEKNEVKRMKAKLEGHK